MTVEAQRAVIADDGNEARLTLYLGDHAAAWIALPLSALVRLSADCSTAASLRLARATKPSRRRRGGDPKAALRWERDVAFFALAQLFAPDQPLEEQARIVIDRQQRYQPMAGEAGVDRRLLGQIRATGLPIPSVDRMVRILSAHSGTGVDARAITQRPLEERSCTEQTPIKAAVEPSDLKMLRSALVD